MMIGTTDKTESKGKGSKEGGGEEGQEDENKDNKGKKDKSSSNLLGEWYSEDNIGLPAT